MNTTTKSGDRRGQTTLDFAIAMGVFLLAIAFVFSFIPTLTAPFLDGDQELSAATDRTASHLAEGALGHPGKPFIAEEPCATALFDERSAPSSCGFEGATTREHLGLSDRIDVEVEMVRIYPDNPPGDRERLVCATSGGDILNKTDSICNVTYSIATDDTPDEERSVTVSRRVVSMQSCLFDNYEAGGACDVTLIVRMW